MRAYEGFLCSDLHVDANETPLEVHRDEGHSLALPDGLHRGLQHHKAVRKLSAPPGSTVREHPVHAGVLHAEASASALARKPKQQHNPVLNVFTQTFKQQAQCLRLHHSRQQQACASTQSS